MFRIKIIFLICFHVHHQNTIVNRGALLDACFCLLLACAPHSAEAPVYGGATAVVSRWRSKARMQTIFGVVASSQEAQLRTINGGGNLARIIGRFLSRLRRCERMRQFSCFCKGARLLTSRQAARGAFIEFD